MGQSVSKKYTIKLTENQYALLRQVFMSANDNWYGTEGKENLTQFRKEQKLGDLIYTQVAKQGFKFLDFYCNKMQKKAKNSK